jgi:hypothetical protein
MRVMPFSAVFAGLVATVSLAHAAQQPSVSYDLQHGLSQPLSSIGVVAPLMVSQAIFAPATPVPGQVPATILLNFDGLSANGTNVDPDADIAVGETQVVQQANPQFAVYDKVTGALVGGPYSETAPWSSIGGPCSTYAGADTVVDYDKPAKRWIIARHASPTGGPFYQCFAVSTSSDATGAWNVYQFQVTQSFPDYQRFGVWSDGYYITNDDLDPVTFAYLGVTVCALDRTAMLAGAPASSVCFQAPAKYLHLVPADIDGKNPPPAGAPNYMMNFKSGVLNLFKFHADFTTPANSTFTGPIPIRVAGFKPACLGGHCIPQPGTAQVLDSVADRLMNRVVYRHFKNYDTLLVSHSVLAHGITAWNGTSGVRWYEIRHPGAIHNVYQQGTFAPDANYRWLPSLAMDSAGDIAVGYSISSSSVNPGIRFTGRVPSDPLGTMENEQDILDGPAIETGSFRWGAYAGMAIDPVDDCTFWFTTQYQPSNGSFNWNTRIASFKFGACKAAP